jgi:PKD repeat protein
LVIGPSITFSITKEETMYKTRLILTLLLTTMLLFASVGTVQAMPPLPSSFYGLVQVQAGDNPPIVGDTVEAYVDGVGVAVGTATIQAGMVYGINVLGDDPEVPGKDGGLEGDIITFEINDRVVATATWHSGTNVHLDFHPPQALPGGPYTGTEGSPINFSGSANDSGSDATTYEWDWENDGTYDETGQTPSHTWMDDGAYTVGLKVTDAQGGEGTATVAVTVDNVAPTVDAGGPYTGDEGSPISFTGTASDPGADTLTYEWDFDYDGSTFNVDASGSLTPSHTYVDDGTYTVALRVFDDDTSVIDTADVTVDNVPPTVDAGGPYTGYEGAAIGFSGSASDPGAELPTCAWDFDYDGITFDEDATGSLNPFHTYDNDGLYTVALRVCDDDTCVIDTADVTVDNVAPTANARGPYSDDEGSPIPFSGTASDPGADTLTYEWDFDYTAPDFDVDASGSLTPSHTYDNDGLYTVALRVCDDDTCVIDTSTVTVNNVAPTVSAGGPYLGDEGSAIAFSGFASDPGADTLTYEWDFDYVAPDFDVDASGSLTPSHAYANDGVYTVALRVCDDDTCVIDTSTATVSNIPPTVDAGGPYTGDEGSAIAFAGTASDPADTLTYAWDFDYDVSGFDEDATGSLTPSHTYDNDGLYTVALRVCDDDTCIIDITTATVDNVPPTVDAGGPYTGDEGSAIAFAGTASDPGADTLTYEWDFDYVAPDFDVDASGSLTPSYTYVDDGTYTVALRVSDDDTSVIDTADVTVDNVPPTVDAGGPYTGTEGAAIGFSGSASDPGAELPTCAWDFDYDGSTFDEDATGSLNPFHTYDNDGLYTVALRVCDDDTCVIDTADVTVDNVPPTVDPGGPYSGDEGAAIAFTGFASDPGADTLTYEWDFDYVAPDFDVDASGAPNPSHTYTDDGLYTVALRVCDDDTCVIETADVTVNDVLPTAADAGGPYSGTAGLPVNLLGSATCAPVDTCTYEWDLDGDTEYDDATGESPSHTWNTIGDYTIGLRVTDDDGNAIYADADVHISGAIHSIGLELGWNLVSFNLQPVSTVITEVLSSIDGNYDLIYAWDASSQLWLSCDNIPMSPDSLHNLDEKMGFWIHMMAADTLDVVGSVPTTTDIDLYATGAGWNLVGYPSAVNRALPSVLEDHGVGTDFSLVYAYHANDTIDPWKLWDRTAWGLGFPQDLTDLSPGWGYWVQVSVYHPWDVAYLAP